MKLYKQYFPRLKMAKVEGFEGLPYLHLKNNNFPIEKLNKDLLEGGLEKLYKEEDL